MEMLAITRVPGRAPVVCADHAHELLWVKTAFRSFMHCDQCGVFVRTGEIFLHCATCTMADDGYDICADCAAQPDVASRLSRSQAEEAEELT
jgi:hypothetical protein